MSAAHISQLIIEYRYWIFVPLSIIEGPIVAFIGGTLASLGYFNIYVLTLVLFIRDLGLDGFWYGLGYWGGKTRLAKRMLAKMKVTDEHMETVRKLWDEKPARTMFIGKLSYGVSGAFIVAAGTVKMPLRKFFGYGFLVTLAQYGVLVSLGYFFGVAYGSKLTGIIENIQYVIAFATLVLAAAYGVSFYMRRKFMREEEAAISAEEKGETRKNAQNQNAERIEKK